MKNVIRLLSIEVNNLKNLKHGTIELDSLKDVKNNTFDFEYADIVGIFGPNGTSKTSFINALRILKRIFGYEDFSADLVNYINKLSNSMSVSTKIYYENNTSKYIYEYKVTISRIDDEAYLTNESLTKKTFDNDSLKFDKKEIVFDLDLVNSNLKESIKTANSYSKLVTSEGVSYLLTMLKGKVYQAKRSLIFNNEFLTMMLASNNFIEESEFIKDLSLFGIQDMHIFDNQEMSSIISNDKLPFFYKDKDEDEEYTTTDGYISIFKDSLIDPIYLNKLKGYTNMVNDVIETIVPNLKIDIKDLGQTLDQDGKVKNKISVVSIKEGFDIPLRYESDGIKKIICILSSYIDAFSNKSCFLAIDELDNGIYEYLLGTILKIFKEEGTGQFIFTSHNLRALEVIKNDIIFSTQDENDRFQKIKGVNTTNNLRNVYIRDNFLNEETFSGLIDANRMANSLLCTKVLINE